MTLKDQEGAIRIVRKTAAVILINSDRLGGLQ